MKDEEIINLNGLQNDYVTHNVLSTIGSKIKKMKNVDIILDFSNCEFISANLFAVLGSIIECYAKNNNLHFIAKNINIKIKNMKGTECK